MRRVRFRDQPVVASINPGIETVRVDQFDRLRGDIGRQRLLFDDREIRLDEQPAVEARDRRFELQLVEQHCHALRRPATGDGEANAGAMQALDRRLGALRQHLVFGDQRAVHVRQDQ